jgi:hypothetical protein
VIGRLCTLLLATVALAAAGDPVAAMLDEARSAPVEIFADVVFHLIETNRIPLKDRAALLDEIFLRATGAREAMPEHSATNSAGIAAPRPSIPIPPARNIYYSPATALRAQLRLSPR